MHGLMMHRPLLISGLLEYAAATYPAQQVVSRTVEGPIHRQSYAELAARARRLARALAALGIGPQDRVATLAWNTHRHLELYYAVSGMGAVCHTINPRLHPDQLAYIVHHAADRAIFADLTFLPLLESLKDRLPPGLPVVLLTDAAHMPATTLPNVLCYEDLLTAQEPRFDWPEFDENTASSLCYTSGTTGNPKGALYSHRSTVLHCLFLRAAPGLGIDATRTILPVVPMFHVNAWGLPYVSLLAGARLVMPGPGLDGESLSTLIEAEGVTDGWGVPTVWLAVLAHMRRTGGRFTTLKRTVIGGSALPRTMIEAFRTRHGVEAVHAWGMTEMSPIGTIGTPDPLRPPGDEMRQRGKQGRAIFGVEMKIVDPEGARLPHDGVAQGELLVRGNTVIAGYFDDPAAGAGSFDAEGWFRTGDVATIDPEGFMEIVDRVKDVIKSGGEWISSIDLENEALAHPALAECAVIGVPHPKWQERPLLIAVREPGAEVSRAEVLEFLAGRVAKWWLPDDVVFVESLPHGATGKLQKARLREIYADHPLPEG